MHPRVRPATPLPRCLPHRLSILLAALLAVLPALACSGEEQGPPVLPARVVAALPHDPGAFTQGLALQGNTLYESTGRYGESTVRRVEADTGRVLSVRALPDDRFGEGLALANGRLLQLTWKSETGSLYDPDTLTELGTFRYRGEGWGLAAGPDGLVMSDGSAILTFLAPDTLKPVRTLEVQDAHGPVDRLNELEWVDGMLWCNLWLSDRIAVVDPADGRVTALVDLAPLRARLPGSAGAANGIAHDPDTGRLLVTGKLWNRVFEIEVDGLE